MERRSDPSATESAMTYVPALTELVAVQPEGTLSRTVLTSDDVRVVLFAFDEGQELTEHTAAMPALLQPLSGRLRVTAAGRTVELGVGDLVHLTTRTPHAVLALEPSILSLTMIDAARATRGD